MTVDRGLLTIAGTSCTCASVCKYFPSLCVYTNMATVHFRSADRQLSLAGKTAIKSFLVALFKKEKQSVSSLTYIFCSDAFLLRLNKDFLQHDYYTDILTLDRKSTRLN